MFTQDDINTLVRIIPTGRQNALTALVIAEKLGYSVDNNQPKTRRLINYAIEHGTMILSSAGAIRKAIGFQLISRKQ